MGSIDFFCSSEYFVLERYNAGEKPPGVLRYTAGEIHFSDTREIHFVEGVIRCGEKNPGFWEQKNRVHRQKLPLLDNLIYSLNNGHPVYYMRRSST